MPIIEIFDRFEYDNFINPDGSIKLFRLFDRDSGVYNIMNTYAESDELLLIVNCAEKLLGLPEFTLIAYSVSYDEWYFHPILVKSILRHIDSSLRKTLVASVVYKNILSSTKNICISFTGVRQSSLLTIVENIKKPKNIGGKEYKCEGILNVDDMFNDDLLMLECTKRILLQFFNDTCLLLNCLCDIICSYL
jgi:hypothetical protein